MQCGISKAMLKRRAKQSIRASLIGAGLAVLGPGAGAATAVDATPFECASAVTDPAACLPETEALVRPPIGATQTAADDPSVSAARRGRPHEPSAAPPVVVADPDTVKTDEPGPLLEVPPAEQPPPDPPPDVLETVPVDPPADTFAPAAAAEPEPAVPDPASQPKAPVRRLPRTGVGSALIAAAGVLLSLGGFGVGAGASPGRRNGPNMTRRRRTGQAASGPAPGRPCSSSAGSRHMTQPTQARPRAKATTPDGA